jgi:periplasmic protein TonB
MRSRETLFEGRRGGLFAAISAGVHLALAGVVVAFSTSSGSPAEEPRIAVDLVAPPEPALPEPVAPRAAALPAQRIALRSPPVARRRAAVSLAPAAVKGAAAPAMPAPGTDEGDERERAGGATVSSANGAGDGGGGTSLTSAVRRRERPAAAIPPEPVESSSPAYPTAARRRRAEGVVLIRARVGRGGAVIEAHVAQTSGARDLDQSALEAVKGWRFRPAMHGRDPLEAWVSVPIRFQLSAGR